MLQVTDNNTGEILSVSQLNRDARRLLETTFASIWVDGEIADFKHHSSGHMYFTLKDESAQIRCAMFRFKNQHLDFKPQPGTQVLLRAKLSLYEPRGDYQLIVEHMEDSGLGRLMRAFEALKKQLASEGLFTDTHKKVLPPFPQQIGVITSPVGAAIRDILTTLKRRFPAIPVVIYPCLVQGGQAAQQIVKAIETANQRQECDLLILARGGGSLEDLWPFNQEIVARSIFKSKIPIVSGVGHEVDTTIADFVADKRAATPTAAAELVTPDWQTVMAYLQQIEKKLASLMQYTLEQKAQQTDYLAKRLIDPRQALREQRLRLKLLKEKLNQLVKQVMQDKHSRYHVAKTTLRENNPQQWIHQKQARLMQIEQTLTYNTQQHLSILKSKLQQLASQLGTLSPLATLERGYVIARKSDSSKILYKIADFHADDKVTLQLCDGKIDVNVK